MVRIILVWHALPLKRERWRAQRDGEGATLSKVAALRSR